MSTIPTPRISSLPEMFAGAVAILGYYLFR